MVCIAGQDSPIEGIFPAPKAWALPGIKTKMTQRTNSVEVMPHLGPEEAIATFVNERAKVVILLIS